MLHREHQNSKAVHAYQRALKVAPELDHVWFNLAQAQRAAGDLDGCRVSLERSLETLPVGAGKDGAQRSAATHMLTALDEVAARTATSMDESYVRDLFDTYAVDYDQHVKKLLFSAPRVIRQEVAAMYKQDGKFNFADPTTWSTEQAGVMANAVEQVKSVDKNGRDNSDDDGVDDDDDACPEASGFTQAESGCGIVPPDASGPLDVLDLGCGTGLAGSWLKDYAKSLQGVDVSPGMVACARKKALYTDLEVNSMQRYLVQSIQEGRVDDNGWDLVVAADSFAYIGALRGVLQSALQVVRPGGLLVFTTEAVPDDLPVDESRGFRLLPSGRFGHTREYLEESLREAAAAAGLQYGVRLSRAFSPRLDVGQPVPGWLFIVERK